MHKNEENNTGSLPIDIEEIISNENLERDRFIQLQEAYIKVLKDIEQEKRLGKSMWQNDFVEKQSEIIEKLQDAGILDCNGEIAYPYKYDE